MVPIPTLPAAVVVITVPPVPTLSVAIVVTPEILRFGTVSVSVFPFNVIDDVPIVRIPVILALPFTRSEVPDAPTAPTSNANLGFVVPIPTFESVLIPAAVSDQ